MQPIAETRPVLTPTPVAAPSGPQWNARRHGMRSNTVLQPGEDAGEFHEMRVEFYALYQPRTANEARCVEAIAGHEWAMERCRRNREHHAGQLHTLLHGRPDGTPAPHCDTDTHRWQHKGMDCTLEERRLSWLQEREKRKLREWQDQRRKNLIAAAREEAANAEARLGAVPHPEPLLGAAEAEAPSPPVHLPAEAPQTAAAPHATGAAEPPARPVPEANGKPPAPALAVVRMAWPDWTIQKYREREATGPAPLPVLHAGMLTACSSAANFP